MSFYKFCNIQISGIASAVPENLIHTDDFVGIFGESYVSSFKERTKIISVRHSVEKQTASDLGYEAASFLLTGKQINPEEIGCLIFASLTPDYRSPATATVLHKRLNISKDSIVYDMILGGTGFLFALQTGCAVLDSINKQYALLIIGDTRSKQFALDNPLRMEAGDGGSAVLLKKNENSTPLYIQTFADGDGVETITHKEGGFRLTPEIIDDTEKIHSNKALYDKLLLNKSDWDAFITKVIPDSIGKFLVQRKKSLEDYDVLALSPDINFISEQIKIQFGISSNLIPENFYKYGNNSGNSIPLLLNDLFADNPEKDNLKILACACGEGLSWGTAEFSLKSSDIFPLISSDDYYKDGDVSHTF